MKTDASATAQGLDDTLNWTTAGLCVCVCENVTETSMGCPVTRSSSEQTLAVNR